MNRTLLLGRIGLAFLLVVIVAVLVVILIFHGTAMSREAIGLVSGAIGALTTVMVFAAHAIYAPNAQMREEGVPPANPTQPESPANPQKVN